MKQRMIVTLLALSVVLCPTLLLAADDRYASPRQSDSAMNNATQATDDNTSHAKLGRILLGLGTAVFVFGVAHPVSNCRNRPCDASTRDAHVFVSGIAIA